MKIGDRVMYRGGWGKDLPVPGTITGKGVKNEYIVYDVKLDTGEDRWGYVQQFEEVPGDDVINPAAHMFLTENGYTYLCCRSFGNSGGWDEYTSNEDRICINMYNGSATMDIRDPEAETAYDAYFAANHEYNLEMEE